ncbi:hypothetical protein JCM8202v2_001589 [Rhodotorula sphaerocarpa]
MATARNPARPVQRSPDATPILRLPQETLDTICAFIRDDDEAGDTTLDGPNTWPRMAKFLEWILLNPSLGVHVRRLDRLVTLSEVMFDVADFVASARDFSNWVLAVAQNTPNLVSVAVDPLAEIVPCFRHLARWPRMEEVSLVPTPPDMIDPEDGLLYRLFLADLERSGIPSLALPLFEDCLDDTDEMPPALAFEVEHLSVADWISPDGRPDELHRYFNFGRVRRFTHKPVTPDGLRLGLVRHFATSLEQLKVVWPKRRFLYEDWERWQIDFFELPTCAALTRLSLNRAILHVEEINMLPTKFPHLEVLDLGECRLPVCCCRLEPDLLLELVNSLPRLRDLRLRPLHHSNSQDLYLLGTVCDARGIEYSGERTFPLAPSDDDHFDYADVAEATPPRSASRSDSSSRSDTDISLALSRNGDRLAGEPAQDDFPWYWVFDDRGRPFAIPYNPDQLHLLPDRLTDGGEDLALALGEEAEDALLLGATATDSDLDFEPEPAYLPALPDEPRFEPGYEAYDVGVEDEYGRCAWEEPEPWLGWVEECDFELADAAWIAFETLMRKGGRSLWGGSLRTTLGWGSRRRMLARSDRTLRL